MSAAEELLASARAVLLVDWPARDVPDSLVEAGYEVVVKGGPGEGDYAARDLRDGGVAVRPLGRPPDRADIVYCHRPLEELGGIVKLAQRLGAGAIWYQSGLGPDGARDPHGCWLPPDAAARARRLVEAAGLQYVDDVPITDAVRRRARR